MRFEINAKTLATAAQLASEVCGNKIMSEVLRHALIDVRPDGDIHITASDDRMQMTRTIRAERVQERGRVCLRADTLAQLTRNIAPASTLTVSHDGNDAAAHITFPRGSFKISAMDPSAYPAKRAEDYDQTCNVPADRYLRDLSTCVQYAETDEAYRYMLCGVHHASTTGGMRLTGADGRRVGTVFVPADGGVVDCIVPRSLVKILGSALGGLGEQEIEISTSDRSIRYVAPGLVIHSSVVDGKFPDVKAATSGLEWVRVAGVRKADIVETLRRMAVVADNLPDSTTRVQAVFLEPGASALSVFVSPNDVEEIEAIGGGEGKPFAVNLRILQSIIDFGGSDEIIIERAENGSAMRIIDLDRAEGDHAVAALMRLDIPQIALQRESLRAGLYAIAA